VRDSGRKISQSDREKSTIDVNDILAAAIARVIPVPGRDRPSENNCPGITAFPAAGSSQRQAAAAGKAIENETAVQSDGHSYSLLISGCLSFSEGKPIDAVEWLGR
jgi:hypothetical protein